MLIYKINSINKPNTDYTPEIFFSQWQYATIPSRGLVTLMNVKTIIFLYMSTRVRQWRI